MTEGAPGGCWAEIDLDKVGHNYREAGRLLAPGARIMAVVKADAYGLGAEQTAQALAEAGCGDFAVTTVAEGLALRRSGLRGNILVLGPTLPPEWPAAAESPLALAAVGLAHLRQLAQWAAGHSPVRLHLEVETGMGRTGLLPEQAAAAWALIRDTPELRPEGVYTHFARGARRDLAYTERQHARYEEFLRAYRAAGGTVPARHVCNSSVFLERPAYHYEYVRLGTLLSGQWPFTRPFPSPGLTLRDPWQGKARVLHVWDAPAGARAGYHSLYRARRPTRLAVIGAGYAHGLGVTPELYPKNLLDFLKITAKQAALLAGCRLGGEKPRWQGQEVKIAGLIGMQLTILDMGTNDCRVGDEVLIPLRRVQTGYNVERCYTKDGRVVEFRRI
ncbi:MAG: alanine racemase [Gracilibacteraceae bacterium]|jgi:alanine racemase|nr:alanine racemase [Gracilibacteraceae bacterium]